MLGPIWSELSAFINDRDPAFLASVKPVPREDITICEEDLGVTLPGVYVDFLTLMGADSGSFHPFGAGQTARFYEVAVAAPPEDFPKDRYFKVAFDHGRNKVTRYSTFLDLKRSDGHDAPLVVYEEVGDFSEDDVKDAALTLAEELTQRVFDSFELSRREQQTLLSMYPKKKDFDSTRERLFELLAKMGLSPVWPPLPRVACLRTGALSVIVAHTGKTQGLTIKLGAADKKTLGAAVEKIKDSFPGAMADDDDD